ncbi:MAG: hypothetical protein AAF533_23430 [Acidobacteriota bacterium]
MKMLTNLSLGACALFCVTAAFAQPALSDPFAAQAAYDKGWSLPVMEFEYESSDSFRLVAPVRGERVEFEVRGSTREDGVDRVAVYVNGNLHEFRSYYDERLGGFAFRLNGSGPISLATTDTAVAFSEGLLARLATLDADFADFLAGVPVDDGCADSGLRTHGWKEKALSLLIGAVVSETFDLLSAPGEGEDEGGNDGGNDGGDGPGGAEVIVDVELEPGQSADIRIRIGGGEGSSGDGSGG